MYLIYNTIPLHVTAHPEAEVEVMRPLSYRSCLAPVLSCAVNYYACTACTETVLKLHVHVHVMCMCTCICRCSNVLHQNVHCIQNGMTYVVPNWYSWRIPWVMYRGALLVSVPYFSSSGTLKLKVWCSENWQKWSLMAQIRWMQIMKG